MDGVELLKQSKIKPEIYCDDFWSWRWWKQQSIRCVWGFDYISKPPDLNRLLNTVRNALDKKQLIVENKILKKKVSKNTKDDWRGYRSYQSYDWKVAPPKPEY
jgi:hypothetical protein